MALPGIPSFGEFIGKYDPRNWELHIPGMGGVAAAFDLAEWIKENPVLAAAIGISFAGGVALVGGVAYRVSDPRFWRELYELKKYAQLEGLIE